MYKLILVFILSFTYTSLNAEPAPFGLEIGKATISDLKRMYKTKFTDKNLYSKGDMYSIDVNSLGIEGIQNATAIFSSEKKLLAIFTIFPKHKFDYLFGTLNKKYELRNKNIPFVGDKSAKFIDGKSTVFLESPHLSFELSMNYIDNSFLEMFQVKSRENNQQRQKNEQSKL